ncbi:MAG: DNA polymerase III subunit alpha [Candidatus Firestonebacteria bacterium]
MKHTEFVHLHNHTEYSLLDGASMLKPLMEAASKLRMPALAITDHGNMFGVIEFYNLALKYGIKPIIGCEVYIAPSSRFEKSSAHGIGEASFHLVLLCKDEIGYRNLIKLVSLGYIEGFYYRPRIDKEILSQYSEGLIGMSSCLKGEIPQLILKGKYDEAKEVIYKFKNIFGEGNFYLELEDHNIPDQYKVNEKLVEYSKELNVPVVATNDCHYINKNDAKIHDILLCVQTKKTLNDADRMRFSTDEFYLKSEEEMQKIFGFVPESIKNTMEIASKCNLMLKFDNLILPDYKIPDGDHDLNEYLNKLTQHGVKSRFGESPEQEVIDRVKHELDIIKKLNFAGYFLIVWDIIKYAKEKNIMVGCGRGSVAGSMVAYCLGITEINSLNYGLFFERFLNPDRISPPDIDVDFEDGRRDEIIEYVTSKYGKDNVAQIITFGTLKRKAAVKAVGRVLGMNFQDVNKLTKMIPNRIQSDEDEEDKLTLKEVVKKIKELNNFVNKDESIKTLIDYAANLEGIKSNVSTHAAGVVIARDSLINHLPLYKESKEHSVVITQFEKDCIEKIGLLKMDFLALKTLTVMKETMENILRSYNIKIEINKIPIDDEKTYNLLCEAKSDGVFQLESEGMKDLLRKFKPKSVKDIMAVIALYRPGPMHFLDEFVKRRHGLIPIKYEHSDLEEILKETYGIMLYQEQVMQIAVRLAGFSMSQADVLRKAMSKKNPEVMEKQRLSFLKGTREKGISSLKAEKIFDDMARFAGYGFNKSHSASYALLAYQTAYLKAHFPLEYYAALLTSGIGDNEKISSYIKECRKAGIEIHPPDVNKCFTSFTVIDKKIYFGLSAIKNIGKSASDSIVEGREKGEYSSLLDFCDKVDLRLVNKEVVESLIKCGAFDSLKIKRLQLTSIIDETIEKAQKIQEMKLSGQEFLFDNLLEAEKKNFSDEEYLEDKLLGFEKELLGVYLSGHPLVKYEEQIKRFTTVDSLNIRNLSDGSEVTIGGIINKVNRKTTKKNEGMAIVSLEDLMGVVEVIIFPTLYKDIGNKIFEESMVIIKGKVDFEETIGDETETNKIKIRAEEVIFLEEADEKLSKKVHIKLFIPGLEESALVELKQNLLKFKNNGTCQVFLHFFKSADEEVSIVETQIKVLPSKELSNYVESTFGEGSIWFGE